MTRKDYENVGRILSGLPRTGGIRLNAVVSACQVFAGDNPRFDRVKFATVAKTKPCPELGCSRIFDSALDLNDHMDYDHEKEEVAQCQ